MGDIANIRDNDIWFHCRACPFHWNFTSEDLVAELGEDITSAELKDRFVCIDCGGHGAQMALSFTGYLGIR